MESSRTDLTTTLLRISRSRFIYGYHMRLPATIARLAELTGELASSTSDGLSERVVKNAVWRTIAAAVRIREFVRLWAQVSRNKRTSGTDQGSPLGQERQSARAFSGKIV